MSKRQEFTTADVAVLAIDQLMEILIEARRYLSSGDDLAAWGTLIHFDDAADDLNAAIRLHKSLNIRRFK